MQKTIDARSSRHGDVFNPGCPSRAVLEMLAGKWALLLVHLLAAGPARTAALRRRIGGVSDKMLIQTLRRLQRNGFVARHAYPEVPPRVEYSLTTLGASLSEPITALDRWVERHLREISLAQREFDRHARSGFMAAASHAAPRSPPPAEPAARRSRTTWPTPPRRRAS